MYQWDPLTKQCVITSPGVRDPNCRTFNSHGDCIACKPRFYQTKNGCLPFPKYCVNVDFFGKCLSCAFGSFLKDGICVGDINKRALNCKTFNRITFLCEQCVLGFVFCPTHGVCILQDPSCKRLSPSQTSCEICLDGYTISKGICLQSPPGAKRSFNNVKSCKDGYTIENSLCVVPMNLLVGWLSKSTLSYSEAVPPSLPLLGSQTFWTPQPNLNNYMLIDLGSAPKAIFAISIRGNPFGWVLGYVIECQNRYDIPYFCYNSCNMVRGNSDGFNAATFKLEYPLICQRMRIIAVSWKQAIIMQLEVYIKQR